MGLCRAPGFDQEKQRTAEILARPWDVIDQWRVDGIISPTKVAKSGVMDVVEVVIDGVRLSTEPILDTVPFEIRLDAGPCYRRMKGRKHETPARADNGEGLGKECSQILQVLGHQCTEKSVELQAPEGKIAVQIRLRKRDAGHGSLRDPEHAW